MKTKKTYQNLFNPESVAIVGASEKEGKVGAVIARNILNLGYKGKIYFVNQSYEKIYGRRCYASLKDIGKHVDVAIVAVPAKFVLDVVADSADKIKNYVIISAGFAEIGAEGKKREDALQELAKIFDLTILGPNCLGFIVPGLKLNASFAGGMPAAGNIAFISQSGALAVALMDIAGHKHLAFSSIISVGNKMQIDEAGLLEYFAQDKNTKVIAMYLEGIKNGNAFIEVANRVSKIKPVVILKAGKSRKSQDAISSHTGALAGSDAIMDVAFKKAGVIRAENLEHFFDIISLMSVANVPENNKVAVITNAGGAGVLSSDAFEHKYAELAEFSQAEQKKLLKDLPQESSAHNPIDVLGDAQEDRYEKILRALGRERSVGSVLNILTPQDQTPVDDVARAIVSFKNKTKKTMVASFIGGDRVASGISTLEHYGVPNFSSPERAVSALDAYCRWGRLRQERHALYSKKAPNSKRAHVANLIIAKAKSENRAALFYSEAAEVMSLYGVPSAPVFEILPKQKLSSTLVYPAVLKVDSDKVLHKSDKQALVVGIGNKREMEAAIRKLRRDFPQERFIIQPQQDKQNEIILGIKKDDIFGPVIVCGLGGIYTEVFKKVDFMIPPVSREEIIKFLSSGVLGFLFKKTRGQGACDVTETARIIEGVIAFSYEVEGFKEFDINPLFLYNDGRTACAVDIKIII